MMPFEDDPYTSGAEDLIQRARYLFGKPLLHLKPTAEKPHQPRYF
jgi:hypothetical protein